MRRAKSRDEIIASPYVTKTEIRRLFSESYGTASRIYELALEKDRAELKGRLIYEFGDIYSVANVAYSAKYGRFNCHDFYLADEATDDGNYNEDIVCWCYMDELTVEVNRCLRDGK